MALPPPSSTPPPASGEPRRDAALRAFDAHRPPERGILDDCVHCGFCLPACPTYVLWGEEMDSPRGRIQLMDLAERGEIGLAPPVVQHWDSCLGCMACVTACPSGVRYDRLIEQVRPQVERRFRRPLGERVLRRLLFAVLPYPRRLRALAPPLVLYRASGAQRALRRSGTLARLPRRLRTVEALAPTLAASALRAAPAPVTPARGRRRGRVALLTGCVQQAFYGDVNAATARVLAAYGWEVHAPRAQGCCGALELHAGREREALSRGRALVAALEAVEPDVVAVNAAGCGSALKDLGRLLADDPEWAARAARFSSRVRDVSEILAGGPGPSATLHALPVRVAYHDACHLAHAQGVRAAPRDVLRAIPGLDLVEIPEGDLCCGSAGVYNLLQPAAAGDLAVRKAAAVGSVDPDALVAANPGCLLQIGAALRRQGRAVPLFHPVELLDASLAGADALDLLAARRRLAWSAGAPVL